MIETSKDTFKTGKVTIQRKKIRTEGTMTIDSTGVELQEAGKTTLKLSFSEIKRIRLLGDGILIYPLSAKGYTGVYYDIPPESKNVGEADYQNIGGEIVEWQNLIKRSPVRVKTISWVIVTCYSIIFLLAFGFILKLFVFPALALIIFAHYKFSTSKK